jgi:hypothetical protein
MRIAGLPPAMQQGLLAALAKAGEDFTSAVKVVETRAGAALPPTVAPLAQPATSVEMLVALAAAEPLVERRRKMAEATNRGLALLEQLHAELLAGALEPELVEELVEWSESFQAPENPQLAALASEIEVRVRVELAKHEMRV